MEGRVPRVKLEAGLTTEALASGLQLGPGKGGDGFAGDGSGERVSEVALATALAVTEATVQKPGSVD